MEDHKPSTISQDEKNIKTTPTSQYGSESDFNFMAKKIARFLDTSKPTQDKISKENKMKKRMIKGDVIVKCSTESKNIEPENMIQIAKQIVQKSYEETQTVREFSKLDLDKK
ncbi:hypothetical protein AKO1_011337 [Acrasis kona]|uniref:Uncharacterized protein n=1 Tax=Acrasis kona TaxID=1008807 RepID=A0AAW2YY38_9EUKA